MRTRGHGEKSPRFRVPASPRRASAILYVLVVMAIGGVVLAAWINLLANRALYPNEYIKAIQRRIVLNNSRTLAVQYFLENVLPAAASGSYAYGEMANGLGTFYIATPDLTPPLGGVEANFSSDGNLNPFSPGGNRGFTVAFPVWLRDGSLDEDGNPILRRWYFQARARSSIYGHDLFTAHSPGALSSFANLEVNGAARLWVQANGITAARFHTAGLTTTPPPSNFAFPPLTSGQDGTNPGYTSSLRQLNHASGLNALNQKFIISPITVTSGLIWGGTGAGIDGVSWDGGGNVTINLALMPTGSGVRITGDAARITLGTSGAAAITSPVLIVYLPTGNAATTIEFSGSNPIRPVHLGIEQSNSFLPATVNFRFTTAGTWRLAATLKNAPANFELGGNLSLAGGIRTNGGITVTGGEMVISRDASAEDDSPDVLAAWLESVNNDEND